MFFADRAGCVRNRKIIENHQRLYQNPFHNPLKIIVNYMLEIIIQKNIKNDKNGFQNWSRNPSESFQKTMRRQKLGDHSKCTRNRPKNKLPVV